MLINNIGMKPSLILIFYNDIRPIGPEIEDNFFTLSKNYGDALFFELFYYAGRSLSPYIPKNLQKDRYHKYAKFDYRMEDSVRFKFTDSRHNAEYII